jgi:hypothetical protein
MERSLLQKTVDLLGKCDLPLPKIAVMSGLGYEWLKRLKRGEIPDPGVNRIEKLHDFLASRIASRRNPPRQSANVA